MKLDKIPIIFFLPLALRAAEIDLGGDATDRHYAAMAEKVALNPEEYAVDSGIGWVLDNTYNRVARPLLKAIPYAGEIFSEDAERLQIAKSSLGKLAKITKEIKRGNEHITNLYRLYEKEEHLRASLTEAWKKAKTLPLLLEISEDLTGIDANPSSYLPDVPATREFTKNWRRCTSKDSEIAERLKAFYQINEYDFRLFAINVEMDSLLKTITILQKQSEIVSDEIQALNSAILNNKNILDSFVEKTRSFVKRVNPFDRGSLKDEGLSKEAELAKTLSDELQKKQTEFSELQKQERAALTRLQELKGDLKHLKDDVQANNVYSDERKKLRDALRKRAGIETKIEAKRRRGIELDLYGFSDIHKPTKNPV